MTQPQQCDYPSEEKKCYYCNCKGHIAKYCYWLRGKKLINSGGIAQTTTHWCANKKINLAQNLSSQKHAKDFKRQLRKLVKAWNKFKSPQLTKLRGK